ncbi:hypothetical protein [Aldersonia kunmingensis]|uniref:hypothetical protein n=1 Tax=Aldersonia kunmingensis TaxID=408066 RepID=UPI00083317FC|nr:hypothetical protein [Aldersonia kunmingensis]
MSVTTTRAAAAAVLTAAAALTIAAPASAAPTENALPTQVREGLADLRAAAGDSLQSRLAVSAIEIGARTKAAGTYAQFAYAAPTFGCNGVTLTAASGSGGAAGTPTATGQLRFQATPAYTGFATGSGLNVAWLNVNNGASGVVPLDDLTEYNLPALAKAVDSGPGSVVAALWGTVTYPAATCFVAPTVGLFNVEPPTPPSAAGSAAPAPAP